MFSEYLMIIAVLSGIIIGYLIVSARLRQILLVFYHTSYRLRGTYDIIYDILENTYTYEMVGRRRHKSRNEFLKLYNKQKPDVNKRFNKIWNHHALDLLKTYGIVIIISVALFWYCYLFFIIPFICIHIVYYIYCSFLEINGKNLYIYMMIEMIIFKSKFLQK
jgi:hypothetical protein